MRLFQEKTIVVLVSVLGFSGSAISVSAIEGEVSIFYKIYEVGVSGDWQRDAQDNRVFRRIRVTEAASKKLGVPIEFFADRRENFNILALRPVDRVPTVFRYKMGERNLDLLAEDIVFDRCYSLDQQDTFRKLEQAVREVAELGRDTSDLQDAVRKCKDESKVIGWYVSEVPEKEVKHFLNSRKRNGSSGKASPGSDAGFGIHGK